MRIFYKGFNFSQDGPGNRLVYHLSGCNLRCPWCSNPEGLSAEGGKDVPDEEIVSEVLRSRPMFFSGGGVTFTGGEASLQKESLIRVLSALRAGGVNTAIETNGMTENLTEISPFVDYFIMDFKHFDDKKLKVATGGEGSLLKRNFEALLASGRELHVRIPLINGFNADSPEGFADYFSKFNTERVDFEFLLYHEYGVSKWKGEYPFKNGFVTKETLGEFTRVFKENNLKVIKS